MKEKTRQNCVHFLKFLTAIDFDDVEKSELESLGMLAEQYLEGTDVHSDANARIRNAIRFLDASERGAVAFEIKSLLAGIEKQIEQN